MLLLVAVTTAAPVWAQSPSPARRAVAQIRQVLEEILADPELDGARVGVHVRSIDDDRVLFDHHGDRPFNPASNMKLLTTAAALHELGPTYVFRTEVRRDPELSDGTLKGNLYVEARGDPFLTTENLFGLVNEIALRGIDRIEGQVWVDDSFFDGVTEGPGWAEETGDPAYAAPIGAFSVNFNTYVLRVLPGAAIGEPVHAEVWPDVGLIEPVVHATTRGPMTPTRLWAGTSVPKPDHVQVLLRGHVALDDHDGALVRRRVHNPTRYAAAMLGRLLDMRGIDVRGGIRRKECPDEDETVPVTTHYSRPLADIVSALNKYSNNFIAEQILKTLGAEVNGAPGTWAKGTQVVQTFVEQLGVPEDHFVFGNGSGLNDVNRVSPRLVAQVLSHMHRRTDLRPEFVSSLAVAGESGTIHGRFRDTLAQTRLRAKTGSLTGVSALSGYVATQDDEVLAFSVMMNDYDGSPRRMWRIQDRIGVALAEVGTSKALAEQQATGVP